MEIKVGEYIRSDSGIILKYEYLKKYEDEVCLGQKGKCWSFEDEEELEDFIEQRIIKHSPNIIDLIECGDYVNGKEVVYDTSESEMYNGHKTIGVSISNNNSTTWTILDTEIKEILTKEQFNQMKYIVGDE